MESANMSFLEVKDTADSSRLPTSTPGVGEGDISEEKIDVFNMVVSGWIIFFLSIFGIITNIINLIVFRRQGFKETITISLAFITVWDLITCVAALMNGVYNHLGYISLVVREYWKMVTHPYVHYTVDFSGFVSNALATWVSVERCLCVKIPFKVKSIFTRRFTLFTLTGTSLITFGLYAIMYSLYGVRYYYDHEFNATLPIVECNTFCKTYPQILEYGKIMSIILPVVCFVVLCVSSVITLRALRDSHEFRNRMSTTTATTKPDGENKGISSKEKQVAKTLLVLIGIYIVVLFPRVFGVCLPSLIEPEFYRLRRYKNIYNVVSDIVFVLDLINQSINLFIFLNMSTNYRKAFYEVFPACKRKSSMSGSQSDVSIANGDHNHNDRRHSNS